MFQSVSVHTYKWYTFILHPRACSWVLSLPCRYWWAPRMATWWVLSGRNVWVLICMWGRILVGKMYTYLRISGNPELKRKELGRGRQDERSCPNPLVSGGQGCRRVENTVWSLARFCWSTASLPRKEWVSGLPVSFSLGRQGQIMGNKLGDPWWELYRHDLGSRDSWAYPRQQEVHKEMSGRRQH